MILTGAALLQTATDAATAPRKWRIVQGIMLVLLAVQASWVLWPDWALADLAAGGETRSRAINQVGGVGFGLLFTIIGLVRTEIKRRKGDLFDSESVGEAAAVITVAMFFLAVFTYIRVG